jgi:hypothetical protein
MNNIDEKTPVIVSEITIIHTSRIDGAITLTLCFIGSFAATEVGVDFALS